MEHPSLTLRVQYHAGESALPSDAKPIVKEPLMPNAFLLHNVLSPSECKFYIEEAERIGWKKVIWDQIVPYRFCDRLHVRSEALSDLLWERIRPHFDFDFVQTEEMPVKAGYTPVGTWRPLRLNRKVRICKYHPGGLFGPHYDGNFIEDESKRSIYTFMIYLNDSGVDYEGGTTDFLDEAAWAESKMVRPIRSLHPKAGMAICFYHNMLHEGGNVTKGQKYIMRTDLLFQRVGADGNLTEDALVKSSDPKRCALELLQLGEDMERAKKYDLATKYYSRAFKMDPSLQNAQFGE